MQLSNHVYSESKSKHQMQSLLFKHIYGDMNKLWIFFIHCISKWNWSSACKWLWFNTRFVLIPTSSYFIPSWSAHRAECPIPDSLCMWLLMEGFCKFHQTKPSIFRTRIGPVVLKISSWVKRTAIAVPKNKKKTKKEGGRNWKSGPATPSAHLQLL